MNAFRIRRRAASAVAMAFILSACSAADQPIGSPRSADSFLSSIGPARAGLSGEKFTSSKVVSKCSAEPLTGTFQASGKARGPFPGTFTARGEVKVVSGAVIVYHERFEIHSGSKTISGSAKTINGDSGSPVAGCSKTGQLSFDMPIIQYQVKQLHNHGSGWSNLSQAKFSEAFQ